MDIDDLKIGDVIHLQDNEGYMNYVLKNGGEFRRGRTGKVMGFARDIGHASMVKVYLEEKSGEPFSLYRGDLKFWNKVGFVKKIRYICSRKKV